MSAIVNLRTSVQIIPRISFKFPSIISVLRVNTTQISRQAHNTPSGPIFVSLTPLLVMKSRARVAFSAFWTRIRGFLLYLPSEVSPSYVQESEIQRKLGPITHNFLWRVSTFV
jgi:hypothetical protein